MKFLEYLGTSRSQKETASYLKIYHLSNFCRDCNNIRAVKLRKVTVERIQPQLIKMSQLANHEIFKKAQLKLGLRNSIIQHFKIKLSLGNFNLS